MRKGRWASAFREQERRHQGAARGSQSAPDLGQVVARGWRQEVREDGLRQDEIDAAVVGGEPVQLDSVRTRRITVGRSEVGALEAEAVVLPKMTLTPAHRRRVHVEAHVARARAQGSAECRHHGAATGADFEYVGAWSDKVELLEEVLHVPGRAFELTHGTDVTA